MKSSLAVICFISSLLIVQLAYAQKVSSYITETWSAGSWVKYNRVTYTYDNNYNQTSELTEVWIGSAWQNNRLKTYSHDSSGSDTLVLDQLWIGSASTWTNFGKINYTNTPTGEKLIGYFQTWNGNIWQNHNKLTYAYDANMHVISLLEELWSPTTSAWRNQSLTTYTNSSTGDPTISQTLGWNSTSNAWANSTRFSASYIAPHKPNQYLHYLGVGNGWNSSAITNFGYDANLNLSLQVGQYWVNSAWQNTSKMTQTWNANNIPLVTLYQNWSTAANTWTNSTRITWTYINSTPLVNTTSISAISPNSANCGGIVQNSGGATVSKRGLCWNTLPHPTTGNFSISLGSGTGSFNSTLTNLLPGTMYYVRAFATNSVGTAYGNEYAFKTSGPTGLEELNRTTSVKLYPQPATDRVQLQLDDSHNSEVSICDINGKMILTATLTPGGNSLDISGLAKGLYFLHLQNGECLKMVKQ